MLADYSVYKDCDIGTEVSVIVPAYNVEHYICDCMDCIIKQTFSKLQIIIIDDGSLDQSGEICDFFLTKDERIVVVHQKNNGVSNARNKGLSLVKGEFIIFADADDKLPVSSIENRTASIGKADILSCQTEKLYSDGTREKSKQFIDETIEIEDYIYELFNEKKYAYQGFLVDKLFRSEIIVNHGIRFDDEIKLNEDRLFLLRYLLICNTVKLSNESVYFYRQRLGSATKPTACGVNAEELTVINCFEKMKHLAKDIPDLYYLICFRAFECGLTLQRRVGKNDKTMMHCLNNFMWTNAILCMKNPKCSITDKIKLILHCSLHR